MVHYKKKYKADGESKQHSPNLRNPVEKLHQFWKGSAM